MAYKHLSRFYNRLMKDCDYIKWSQSLLTWIKKNSSGSSCVDLACGTGTITKLLAKNNIKMVGIDNSQEMLSQAVSLNNSSNIIYLCQSMTTFKLMHKVDSATSVCDGINYLKDIDEVKKCFTNVYNALNDKGVFIFDISSQYKLTQVVGNNIFFQDLDDLTYLWTNKLNVDNVVMDVTFFERDGDKYSRYDERHIQHIYEEGQLRQLLLQVGFNIVETYDNYSNDKVTDTTQRITFVAVKDL